MHGTIIIWPHVQNVNAAYSGFKLLPAVLEEATLTCGGKPCVCMDVIIPSSLQADPNLYYLITGLIIGLTITLSRLDIE